MTDEATRRQTEAATPTQSVWLAANAGSGKTRVLIDRVARLLLDGSPPENILCLTYTKAAAGEMQNRLFERLGSWAMMADDAMRDALGRLGVDGPLDEQRLAAARRLFARAIEAHGGLKIQTIHAFCASLLRLFPREAGVSPDFTEMDDRSRRLLTDDVLDGLSSGGEAAAIDGIARFLSQDDDIRGLIGGILTHRAAFASPMTTASCFASLDLPPDFDEDTLAAETYSPDDIEILADLCRAMSTGSRTDQRAADRLAPVADKALSLAALPVLEALFLTGASANAPFTAKTGKFPTKATRARLTPDTQVGLDALMMRVESARPRRLALAAARRNAALHTFAGAFLPAYDAAKSARGWLDFDDLVRHAHGLLSDPGVADWVLFRLDGR
ncbi:MAG: UvrD-helicase domain-containing protein, partial [Pseudomonadota bacterium]